jgi:hypothetical protein
MKAIAFSFLYSCLIVAGALAATLGDYIGRVPHDLPFWRGVVMKLLITAGMVGGAVAWNRLAKVVWPKRRA